ncbi:hypothetical protein EDB83DRAFT_2529122 [Lactarius deliciosus]|nr:hypothetical protein EDB83DRAFT_2529122 [Lactarius deliciosus]
MSSETPAIRHSKRIQKCAPSPTEIPAVDSLIETPSQNAPHILPTLNHSDPDSSSSSNAPDVPSTSHHADPDSSSDTIIIQNARDIMSDQKTASVSHPILSRAPILTDGEITPKIVRNFENHCATYFLNTKDGVPNDTKVTRIIGCFENSLIYDWAQEDSERLIKLSFTEFMKEFREQWLPANWEQNVRTEMLNSRLDPSQKFDTWAAQILSYNVSLRNTKSHMTDDQLRTQLETALDEELRIITTDENINTETDLRKWMAKIRNVDNRRQNERKRMADFWETKNRAKRQNIGSRFPPLPDRNSSIRGNTPSTNPQAGLYPPKLTDDERRLLHDHEGCLKCRVFYAGHRADKCTTTLSGKDYKQHTLQDALRAKSTKPSTRPTPIASITETSMTNGADLVAAVFPMSSAVASDSSTEHSETSLASVRVPPPLKERHLTWLCELTNPIDHLWVNTHALIDSGAHMVLIRPDLVDRLKLPKLLLERPERIAVAIDATTPPHITHYVILQPASIDKKFMSQPLHAVIAPGLCMPLILGLPFLTVNKIVCNYAERTCIVTNSQMTYDLLSKRKPYPPKDVDILAAIRERVETLTRDETMAQRENELWTRFREVFEPPPHADELPTKPLARIKLKDAK